MATAGQWMAGARPRTLPAAITPVAVGTAIAAATRPGPGLDGIDAPAATLALLVAVALQVGVNYANDYSDGIRGTDSARVGPFRLVGSGAASARSVLHAALASFAVAAVAGLALTLLTSTPELLLLGAACLAAAWFYTGGQRPYGYRGLGEVAVFVFFGLIAVAGTVYVQVHSVPFAALLGGIGCGALACALLVVNNLRDIPSDTAARKRTLAVRLGDLRTRRLYRTLLLVAAVAVGALALAVTPWALLALGAAPLAARALAAVGRGATGRDLVPVLGATGRLQLVYGVLLAAGLLLD